MDPAYLPLKANRFTTYSATLTFKGFDMTGCVLKAQVRPSTNDAGAPLVDLAMVSSAVETGVYLISASAEESLVSIYIEKSDIEAMATAAGISVDAQTDDVDLVFAWDLVVTTSAGLDDVIVYGPFILRAGVTQ